MAGVDLPDELPESWIERAELLLGAEVPTTLSEAPLAPSPADDEAAAIALAVLRT